VDNFYQKIKQPPRPPLKAVMFGLMLVVMFGLMSPTLASVFPNDAITKTFHITGASTQTITGGSSTILGVQAMQSAQASNTSVLCGANEVFLNMAKDTPFILMNYVCSDTLTIVKTGNDTSFTTITYVPYVISSSNSDMGSFNQSLANNATPLKTFAFMTAGDIAIVLMLFVLIMLSLLTIWFRKV